MAKINIIAPMKTNGLVYHEFASPKGDLILPKNWVNTGRAGVKKQIENILNKPQNYIENGVSKSATLADVLKKASELTNMPQNLILAFIMTESGGKFDSPVKDTAGGLVHWKAKFIGGKDPNNPLKKEFTSNRLSDAELKFLNSYGIKFDEKGNTPNLDVEKHVKNPYVNAYIGAMILSQYLDSEWGRDQGTARVDRMIARYNWGLDGFKSNNLGTKSVKALYSIVPEVTKRYIAKILGKDALMDVLINDIKMTY